MDGGCLQRGYRAKELENPQQHRHRQPRASYPTKRVVRVVLLRLCLVSLFSMVNYLPSRLKQVKSSLD